MTEHVETIRVSNYFDGLNDKQLSAISKLASKAVYKKGAALMTESSPGESVILVVEGRVDISVSLVGSNKSETIATLGTGEMVGEMILLGRHRRSANVVAKDDVEALTWSGKELTNYFESDAASGFVIMRNIARHLAERLSNANQVLRNTLSLSNNHLF